MVPPIHSVTPFSLIEEYMSDRTGDGIIESTLSIQDGRHPISIYFVHGFETFFVIPITL